MAHKTFDLAAAARQEMIADGFNPDFAPGTDQQLSALQAKPAPAAGADVRDMRDLIWSSIDNDTSRDLDQAEVADRIGNAIRIRIAIADVDSDVSIDSPIDKHAANQTTTVYTGVKNFSMLPEQLSTGLTSLNENADRLAVIVEMSVTSDGTISLPAVYRALVRNHAQLTYNGVGPWFEGTADAPPKVAASPDLAAQLKLQDEAAQLLCERRHRLGALDFDRVESEPIISDGQVQSIATRKRNRASRLIEDFMIAANEVMAQTLAAAGRSSIRRVVRSPSDGRASSNLPRAMARSCRPIRIPGSQ